MSSVPLLSPQPSRRCEDQQWSGERGSLHTIALEVTSAGSSGALVRLGIWQDDGTGKPGTLILDAGTIDGTSNTFQSISISQAVGPGLYWIGGVIQGSPATQPTLRTVSQPIWGSIAGSGGSGLSSATYVGMNQTGVTGALGNWSAGLAPGINAPRVILGVQ